MPRIDVIIVNYGAADLIMKGLDDLVAACAPYDGSTIYIVDNCSPGNDRALLEAHMEVAAYGSKVVFLKSDKNGGFSYGNNVALRAIQARGDAPEYVFFLNPDAYVLEGALDELVMFMDQHPQVGFAGSRIEYPDGSLQRSAFRFPTWISEFETALSFGPVSKLLQKWQIAPIPQDQTHQTDWVSGASFLTRWSIIEEIGLMDQSYFLYFEEVDWMLQAKQQGWEAWHISTSRVIHLMGQATGMTEDRDVALPLPDFWYDSRERFFTKNYGYFYAGWTNFCWLIGAILSLGKNVFDRPRRQKLLTGIKGLCRYGLWPKRPVK